MWSQQQDGALYGLDAATGQTRALLQVGDSTRFATPALSGNALFVATRTGITATTIAPVRRTYARPVTAGGGPHRRRRVRCSHIRCGVK